MPAATKFKHALPVPGTNRKTEVICGFRRQRSLFRKSTGSLVFTLRHRDLGHCNADKSRSPKWERAEARITGNLTSGKRHKISVIMEAVDFYDSHKGVILQLARWRGTRTGTRPFMMFKLVHGVMAAHINKPDHPKNLKALDYRAKMNARTMNQKLFLYEIELDRRGSVARLSVTCQQVDRARRKPFGPKTTLLKNDPVNLPDDYNADLRCGLYRPSGTRTVGRPQTGNTRFARLLLHRVDLG